MSEISVAQKPDKLADSASCSSLIALWLKWLATPSPSAPNPNAKKMACRELANQMDILESRKNALDTSATGCRKQVDRWLTMGASKPKMHVIRATVERALEFDKQATIASKMQQSLQRQQLMVENAQMNADSCEILKQSRRIMASTGVGSFDDVERVVDELEELTEDIDGITNLLVGNGTQISDGDIQEELDRLMSGADDAVVCDGEHADDVGMGMEAADLMRSVIKLATANIIVLPDAPTHHLVQTNNHIGANVVSHTPRKRMSTQRCVNNTQLAHFF